MYPLEFKEYELVLKTILPIEKDSRGKLTLNYEGSYVVKKATINGEEFPLPVNSDTFKNYIMQKSVKKPTKSKTRKGDLGKKGYPGESKS